MTTANASAALVPGTGSFDRASRAAAKAAERASRAYGRPGGVLAAVVSCVLIVTAGTVYTIITLTKNAPGPAALSPEDPAAFATRGYVDAKFSQVLKAIEDETKVRLTDVTEIKTLLRSIDDKLFQVVRSSQPTGSQR